MAAASDLAAMGAEPIAALSALVLAELASTTRRSTRSRAAKPRRLDAIGAPVVGGNLARGTETSITTTLLGRAATPVLRSGARPGDGLWLAGPVGLASAGLAILERIRAENARIWSTPMPQRAFGVAAPDRADRAGEGARAASLTPRSTSRTASRTTPGSSRTPATCGSCSISRPSSLRAVTRWRRARGSSRQRREDFALHGGEDYALLAASADALPGFVRIGSVESATDKAYDGARVVARDRRRHRPGRSARLRSLRVIGAGGAGGAEGQNPAQTGGTLRPASAAFRRPSSGALPLGPACAAMVSHCAAAPSRKPASGDAPMAFAWMRS